MTEQQAATLIPLSCRRVRQALKRWPTLPKSLLHSHFRHAALRDIREYFPEVPDLERGPLAEAVVLAAYQTLQAWLKELQEVAR